MLLEVPAMILLVILVVVLVVVALFLLVMGILQARSGADDGGPRNVHITSDDTVSQEEVSREQDKRKESS
jgi:cell division septal protein FtsQ